MNKKPFAFQLAGAGAVRLGYIPLFKLVSGLFFYFIIIKTLSESTTICQEMCNAQKKTAQFCEIQWEQTNRYKYDLETFLPEIPLAIAGSASAGSKHYIL